MCAVEGRLTIVSLSKILVFPNVAAFCDSGAVYKCHDLFTYFTLFIKAMYGSPGSIRRVVVYFLATLKRKTRTHARNRVDGHFPGLPPGGH